MTTRANLTVIILTFNEEKHVTRCLESAFQVATTVFVVDSFSTDRTVAIAEGLGARVWQHEFTNHALQLEWALRTLPIDTEWVMRVDADELITSKLARHILHGVINNPPDVNGFLVCRHVRFMGGLIRHGNFPQWHLRVWRHGQAEIEQRWMDEHMVLKSGKTERLKGALIDDSMHSLSWWTDKHNNYASREAIDLLNRKYCFLPLAEQTGTLGRQARHKRWLKDNLYARLPLGLRALAYYLHRMIFQLGFLDGRAGLAFHFLQGFWYRSLVDAKVWEVERAMRHENIECAEAIRNVLGVNPT